MASADFLASSKTKLDSTLPLAVHSLEGLQDLHFAFSKNRSFIQVIASSFRRFLLNLLVRLSPISRCFGLHNDVFAHPSF